MTGYFNNKKLEYIITDMKPVRPLINYVFSDSVVGRINHFGYGSCLASIGSVRRSFINGERHVYIKREGEVYSANRNFFDLPFYVHQTHVGMGYSKIVSEYKGLRVELTICVPFTGYAELSNIRFVNTGKDDISFNSYYYLKPEVNTTWHIAYSRGGFLERENGLLYSHNAFPLDDFGFPHEYNTIFVKSDTPIKSWAVTDTDFIGHYGTTSCPKGLDTDVLLSRGATFESYCSAMQFEISLKAGEERSVNVVVSVGKNEHDAVESASCCSQQSFLRVLNQNLEQALQYNCVFDVSSPDEYLDTLVNIWLKRQISLGKTWGRVYGKGFRDIMQDIASFVSFDTPLAKQRILHTLSYQFTDGNTIRQFDPIMDVPYVDGAAWIPATVLAYINESGDVDILNEQTGYYESDVEESVFMHIKRGIDFLTANLGKHGLCLWGGGDWNDSLNNCGTKGVGESVWLSIATVKAVKEFAQIADMIGEDVQEYVARAEIISKNVLEHGFEGDRFIYGYNDLGEKIGSRESAQAKLYLNPQTWAVLSGIASGDLAEKICDVVERELKTDFGYKQCNPSYSVGTDSVGRASYFVEGIYENGSVYNHGVMFKLVSDCVLKKGDRAYQTFLMSCYNNPNNPNNGMEPYAIANMYFGDDCPYKHQVGFAPLSWITGAAGWLYRGLTEYLLGIRPCLNGLIIDPVLSDGFDNISITRTFRGAKYNITIKRGEAKGLYVDGKKQADNIAIHDGKNHTISMII